MLPGGRTPQHPFPRSVLHRVVRFGLLALFVVFSGDARAERFAYEPVLDAEDGELVDGVTWRAKTWDATVADLLLTLGSTGGSKYANHLAFLAPDLSEGQTLADVRLRVNMQGGVIASPLEVTITAALEFNPAVPPGAARLAFPRTASVSWQIPTAWDSSGQKIAKWVETPNLAPIVEEVMSQSDWEEGGRILFFYLEAPGATGIRTPLS